MRVISCLFTEHNLWLVGLAAIVCVAGSLISFRLFTLMRDRMGPQALGWGFLTAVAAGSSVWCTHFVAMLAYQVNAPVEFDPVLTMLSLTIAIAGCGLGFYLCAHKSGGLHPAACGAIIGASIAFMHYTGMAAYHVSGIVEWSVFYVVSSVLIAAALSAAAISKAVYHQDWGRTSYTAPAFFVLAIVGLHFTGMAAVQVTPLASDGAVSNSQAFESIAVAVAGVGLMIIGTGVASYLIDEQSSQESRARLQQMALNDSLTGLPNRAHFSDYISQELQRARDNSQRLATVGVDLDRFKEINDQYGHEAGDLVLKSIGERLEKLVKPGEFVARIGGDEFAAIKRYRSDEDLHEFLARIERALNEPIRIDDLRPVTGGSIGVALFPQDGDDPTRLITNADLAMYRAKRDVRRKVCFYEKRMDEAARKRALLASDLKTAISENEFELHYQVQNDVHTRAVTAYEVLLRWRHPQRGWISPTEFIPIAEETGIIVEIGEWVLRTACREASTWSEPTRIAVNVSGVQLRHGDLAEIVHDVLFETGLPPSRLEIEITETAIIEDKTRALYILRRIRGLGVSVAIDDFGVGYSSLETLRAFPFDKIKLDRSFTRGLDTDPQSLAIVRAVLALGKSLDVRVLAEGVETDKQLQLLSSEGCNEAQGYLLGRPKPMAELFNEQAIEHRDKPVEPLVA